MKIVNKPWGYEKWIGGDGEHYFMKQIMMKAGFKSSLQRHERKRELIYILSGQGLITVDDKKYPFKPDSYFQISPPTVHRIEAISDLLMMEVSTIELDDVVRLSDDWNRKDGRIESEHK